MAGCQIPASITVGNRAFCAKVSIRIIVVGLVWAEPSLDVEHGHSSSRDGVVRACSVRYSLRNWHLHPEVSSHCFEVPLKVQNCIAVRMGREVSQLTLKNKK